MIDNLITGFLTFYNAYSIIAVVIGLVGGIIAGALPGLTATMAIAVLSPFTFFLEPSIGLPFLLAVYKGAIYGGSIPAIMINTPGTAAAAATALDGYKMACRGEPRRALEISLFASVTADLLGTIVLIFVAAPLAAVALKFSSPEFTMLFAFSLTMIAAVSGRSLTKGLISAGLGILLACVGLDPMTGYERYTFGSTNLMAGVSLVPLLIGMFAISEILIQAENGARRATLPENGGSRASFKDYYVSLPTILRSTGIGTFLGALPGLGAEISCWISYGIARKRSKDADKFGKGSLEGIVAAESGNNAVCPAALIPMLVFGIPGDTITEVLLGAFMAQGLLPGPLLFIKHGEVLYGLFSFLLLTNVLLLVFGYLATRYLAKVILIPNGILFPIVLALCFTGSFAVNSSFFDILITLCGGIAGYFMRKTEVPIPPLVISLLLAPRFEDALRQSMMFSDNNPIIFISRPISATILALLVGVLLHSAWRSFLVRRTTTS